MRTSKWFHYDLPGEDALTLRVAIEAALQESGWYQSGTNGEINLWEKGSLQLSVATKSAENGYAATQYELMTADYNPTDDFRNRPWDILKTGFRKVPVKGTGRKVSYGELAKLLPAHVELGCGPSIEAGIPPLHDLHYTYKVTNPFNKEFVWTVPQDQLLLSIIHNPEDAFQRFAAHFLSCFASEPSPFYFGLADLAHRKLLLGPVLNNNFDGLASRVGLEERCIRRFEEAEIVPDIDFHPDAKALFVFGCHADRRRVQEAARLRGLTVVHLDPEGFYTAGEFKPYPLEAPQDHDLIVNDTANQAMQSLLLACGVPTGLSKEA